MVVCEDGTSNWNTLIISVSFCFGETTLTEFIFYFLQRKITNKRGPHSTFQTDSHLISQSFASTIQHL
jgi:hypothetical protein